MSSFLAIWSVFFTYQFTKIQTNLPLQRTRLLLKAVTRTLLFTITFPLQIGSNTLNLFNLFNHSVIKAYPKWAIIAPFQFTPLFKLFNILALNALIPPSHNQPVCCWLYDSPSLCVRQSSFAPFNTKHKTGTLHNSSCTSNCRRCVAPSVAQSPATVESCCGWM